MNLTSSAFAHNTDIPAKYTCDGNPPAGGINPPLHIADVPEAAKSLILICDDPDASIGLWVHWTVWNINPSTIEIAENSVPVGAVQGVTNFGKPGYGGPCPGSGKHRYFFKLYALDDVLDLAPTATKEDLEKTMEGHVLDKTELMGLYQRS